MSNVACLHVNPTVWPIQYFPIHCLIYKMKSLGFFLQIWSWSFTGMKKLSRRTLIRRKKQKPGTNKQSKTKSLFFGCITRGDFSARSMWSDPLVAGSQSQRANAYFQEALYVISKNVSRCEIFFYSIILFFFNITKKKRFLSLLSATPVKMIYKIKQQKFMILRSKMVLYLFILSLPISCCNSFNFQTNCSWKKIRNIHQSIHFGRQRMNFTFLFETTPSIKLFYVIVSQTNCLKIEINAKENRD